MFWDKVAFAYDFFEKTYNGKVYANTGKTVAEQTRMRDRRHCHRLRQFRLGQAR